MTSKVEPYFDEIVALVAEGVPVAAALKRRPEYPALATWKLYAFDKRFPDRRRRLEEAQAQGSSEGRSARYAEEVIALVEGGKTIGEALASNPNYPVRSKFRLYVLAHPDLEVRINKAKPNRSKVAPFFEQVQKRIDRGDTIVSALEALPIKVSRTCLAKFIEKTDERRAWLQAQQVRRARRSSELRTPALVRHDKRERQFERTLYSNELYRIVDAAVPKHIEGTIREDVVADIIVAVLSEEITTDEIGSKVKKLSAGYFKADRFRNQSLHAPAMHGSTMTIAETVCPDFSEWRC